MGEAEEILFRLDTLLPFSMQTKAQAMQELTHRAAWQESNKEANIIQWTGLDAEAQERRLKATKKLYESASRDFEYLLGQDAIGILDKLEVGYAPVNDQHTMISRFNKDREREAEAVARQQMQLEFKGSRRTKEDLPPLWEELLKERPNL